MAEKKVRGPVVSATKFVSVFKSHCGSDGPDYTAIAKDLGLTVNTVVARATKYRAKYKIPLAKRVNRNGGTKLDLDALRALAVE